MLNERYACYREIQLPGFEKKDVEYCEYVNLADTQAKYDCIDALNKINAGDDAVEECFQQDDGLSNRKESVICKIVKTDILFELYGEPKFKGADYCYFRYPWADQSYQRLTCL